MNPSAPARVGYEPITPLPEPNSEEDRIRKKCLEIIEQTPDEYPPLPISEVVQMPMYAEVEKEFEDTFRDECRDKLRELMKDRPWRPLVQQTAMQFIEQRGIEHVTLEQVVGEVRDISRAALPLDVANELYEMCQKFCAKALENRDLNWSDREQ
uniref:Enhancer of yellow 2 transcription factor homolog n=1 Tax=Steinernema glaseri TaxID=37863 RepID=A0A1I7YG40_9BILA